MALIAILAVVNVVPHTLMLLVGLRLGMTDRARKDRIIRRVGVAVTAGLGSSVIHREPGVIERGIGPRLGVMAELARGWEASRLMVWIGGVVVILLVARVTIRGKVLVVIVHVALVAGDLDMRAGKRPTGCPVIELAIRPRHRVVTHLAGLGEPCGLVGRIVRLVVVIQVARRASGIGELVVVVHMALRTLQRFVRAGQRPAGLAVIELCSRP